MHLKVHQFHRKAPMLDFLFNKVEVLKACNFIKRDSNIGVPVNIAKFLKTPILKNICERLLMQMFNPLSSNFTKWSNTLKQFIGTLPTNCLSVFDYFMGLAFKGLIEGSEYISVTNLLNFS